LLHIARRRLKKDRQIRAGITQTGVAGALHTQIMRPWLCGHNPAQDAMLGLDAHYLRGDLGQQWLPQLGESARGRQVGTDESPKQARYICGDHARHWEAQG
jgi:hypothetical protein